MRLLPERRQRWRIVTLKNAAWFFGGLIALFIAVSAWNELRPGNPARDRLYQRGTGNTPPADRPRPAEVVEERPVEDQTSAPDRGSRLLAPQPPPPPPPTPVATPAPPRRTTLKQARQRGERIVITGGAEGLRVEAAPATTTTQ